MVDQENMQRWIDALRSGEYRQIRGALESPAGNCAEGVACREAQKAGVSVRVSIDVMDNATLFDGAETWMPRSVREWLGFPDGDGVGPRVTDGTKVESVIVANDNWVWSFAEIADALYAQYLKEPDNESVL